MTEALGRALWTILKLEETLIALLADCGDQDFNMARGLPAQGKIDRVRTFRKRLASQGAPQEVLEALASAADAYEHAKDTYRNRIAHGIPVSTPVDPDGGKVSGLRHVDRDGVMSVVAEDAQDMLGVAKSIEKALSPVSDARTAIRAWTVSQL
jgi:hypothetical protein